MPKRDAKETATIDTEPLEDMYQIADEMDEEAYLDEAVEGGIEKFSRTRKTKMKDEMARYKNKKKNKGREKQKKHK